MTASDHLKQATGSLGGDQIPEDLKGDYDDLVYCKEHRDEGTVFTYYMDGYLSAIERIAKAEASLAQKTRECEELQGEIHGRDLQLELSVPHTVGIRCTEFESKCADLELENSNLKTQVEQLGRQVAEMSKEVTHDEIAKVQRSQKYGPDSPTYASMCNAVLASRARTK